MHNLKKRLFLGRSFEVTQNKKRGVSALRFFTRSILQQREVSPESCVKLYPRRA
jgi:hypothetical protein